MPGSAEDAELVEGLITGTILGTYRFDRFKSVDPDDPPPPALDSLTLLAPEGIADAAESARICAEAQNPLGTCKAFP